MDTYDYIVKDKCSNKDLKHISKYVFITSYKKATVTSDEPIWNK